MAKVFVTINPKTGQRTYEIEGVGGVSCDEITQMLMVDNEVEGKEYKEEYYQEQIVEDYV